MESTFIEAIKALGIAGGPVFAILWWIERVERKQCQAITQNLLIQSLTVTNQATHSVTQVTSAVHELREGMKESSKSLAQLIRSTVIKKR